MTAVVKAGPEALVRPAIRALSAYHVPDAQGLIKLDAMENPYGWPPELVDEWLAKLRDVHLNRYPDPQGTALKMRLRDTMGIPPESGLVLGNGSDELIQLVVMALAAPGRVVLAPEPSFVMYRMIACFAGMDYVGVPLRTTDFGLDAVAMLAAIGRHQPAVIFLAYPNNPSGNLFARDDVRRMLDAAPGLVVIDEAYFSFASHSFLPELLDYGNLLVMRTVSKMGLAGLRLGFLMGAPDWLDELEKLRLPYNINVLTQASARFALEHADLLDEQARRIRGSRARLFAELSALPGVTAFPSEANFILFRTPAGCADRLFAALREAGVLVKNLNGAGGTLRDCLRVTVGASEENQAFIKALRTSLQRIAV
jgi:histidinol-phosphate aminotransferase